jgi:hypothetical protein
MEEFLNLSRQHKQVTVKPMLLWCNVSREWLTPSHLGMSGTIIFLPCVA